MTSSTPKGDTSPNINRRNRAFQADNEHLARCVIDAALAKKPHGTPVHSDIARVIAATMHGGKRTWLARFAATGTLRSTLALSELRQTTSAPPSWWLAMEQFLDLRNQP